MPTAVFVEATERSRNDLMLKLLGSRPKIVYSTFMEESKTVDALQALGHATRLQAFRALVVAGPNGLPAGTLAAETGVPASTLSSHLSRLENAGLIHSQRRSRQIFYAVQIEAVRRLLGYLIEDCCQGQPELCGGVATLAAISCEECD